MSLLLPVSPVAPTTDRVARVVTSCSSSWKGAALVLQVTWTSVLLTQSQAI